MWEYKVIEIKEHSLNEVLNNLGKQGWELCGMKDNDFIFKRGFAHSYNSGIDYSRYEPPYKVTCNS